MEDETRQPDELLEEMRREAQAPKRGKLKIFFGYAAGVGKTFSMLEAARNQVEQGGKDIALGYVEPHAPETEALMLGMELLPTKEVSYRGITLKELDLDAALARKPDVLIVDEMAHANAPGMRHAKRWQDIEDLLDAGINVYTTLNVQHLESLNDVVAQISGIQVRETVPDTVVDQADSIELVDLPPEELLERFREGKVYIPAQAERAMSKFFRLPNLIALRELSLRRLADRVNAQVQTARTTTAATQVWATRECLLVCVSPSPTSARVIRIAKRMASALRAPWIAVNVETGDVPSESGRQKLSRNFRLAEELGAETVTLSGEDPAEELVRYAHTRNVTKILIGKTGEPEWREVLGTSIVSRVLRRSGDIDVYVIRGREETAEPAAAPPAARRQPTDYRGYAMAVAATALCTGVAWLMHRLGLTETNQVMVFFLGTAFVAAKHGRGPGILAAVASVLSFDFFFVPPYYTFTVNNAQYFVTFAVMFVIAMLISVMAHRIRRQADFSRDREHHTEALYRLSRRLAATSGTQQLVATAESQLAEMFAAEIAIFLPDESDRLKATAGGPHSFAANPREIAVAQWAFEHSRPAGAGTDTLPDAHALYVPLVSPHGTFGVLAIRHPGAERFTVSEERQLLETLASLVALAIERDQLAEQAQKVLVQAEAERLRSSLLSSVSHDLRTPLAAIAGAGSSLLEADHPLTDTTRRELLQTVVDESNRLALLVDNLLQITRVESGLVAVNKQWYPIEEVVGSALERMRKQLADRPVRTHVPEGLPLVKLDGVLIEQVLVNLFENAVRYTPDGSPIDIFAEGGEREVTIEVADRGPGLTDEERQRVFEKFYRGSAAGRAPRGSGLGLAICRAAVAAHGGRIWEENRPDGGARFLFTIPMEEPPPEINTTEEL